jgi:hypothetical protein
MTSRQITRLSLLSPDLQAIALGMLEDEAMFWIEPKRSIPQEAPAFGPSSPPPSSSSSSSNSRSSSSSYELLAQARTVHPPSLLHRAAVTETEEDWIKTKFNEEVDAILENFKKRATGTGASELPLATLSTSTRALMSSAQIGQLRALPADVQVEAVKMIERMALFWTA